MNQASLGSLHFYLLWINPETFIMPVIVLSFCSSSSSYFIFTCWINMQAYLCADCGLITLLMIHLPTSWSTCCSLLVKVSISLGSPCAPPIYNASTMYAYFSLRRLVLFPLLFLTTIFAITSLTILFVIFPTPMRSHMCFREEHFSEGNITSRETVRVDFGTPKFPRISE